MHKENIKKESKKPVKKYFSSRVNGFLMVFMASVLPLIPKHGNGIRGACILITGAPICPGLKIPEAVNFLTLVVPDDIMRRQ